MGNLQLLLSTQVSTKCLELHGERYLLHNPGVRFKFHLCSPCASRRVNLLHKLPSDLHTAWHVFPHTHYRHNTAFLTSTQQDTCSHNTLYTQHRAFLTSTQRGMPPPTHCRHTSYPDLHTAWHVHTHTHTVDTETILTSTKQDMCTHT